MVLVGRLHEIGELEQLLELAAHGSGGVLALTGAAGSGKTALAQVAIDAARRRRFDVYRGASAGGQCGRLVWAQLLRDVGAADDLAARLLADPGPLDLDEAARQLASARRRLIVVDNLDRGGRDAIQLLSVLATRVVASSTAVIVTAGSSLGTGRELRLGGLSEDELALIVDELNPEARHALWVASRGLPGVARALAVGLARLGMEEDPQVYVALHAPSTAEFLEVDTDLIGLLEAAVLRARDDAARARVLARLAYELLGDASAGARRRGLIREAVDLARRVGDAQLLAEVLDARLHALWDQRRRRRND